MDILYFYYACAIAGVCAVAGWMTQRPRIQRALDWVLRRLGL